jgi:heme/copper-type cytochrome/quinol oxidase subunit 4
MDKNKSALGAKTRVGIIVFVVLIVLEVVEYVLGVTVKHGNWPIMAILALIGAWPIAWYFMHLPQLWHREEE